MKSHVAEIIGQFLKLGHEIIIKPRYNDLWERLIEAGASFLREEQEMGPSDFAPDEIYAV